MNRAVTKVAAVWTALLLLLGGVAVTSTPVLVVDVEEAGGPNVVLPVPLPLARAGVAFAPGEAAAIPAPEAADHLPRARRVVRALREAPDGLLVDVAGRSEHVTVRKDGDVLRVRAVDGEATRVEVNVPLGSVDAALGAYDAEERAFETAGLVSAIGDGADGRLVHVRDDGNRVELRIW